MVFAINAPDSGERTFSAFETLAKGSQGGTGGYGSPTDPGSAASIRIPFLSAALALLASAALL